MEYSRFSVVLIVPKRSVPELLSYREGDFRVHFLDFDFFFVAYVQCRCINALIGSFVNRM